MFNKMTLERTMCYGECPVYTIDISNDGLVTWRGEMFVSKQGEHRWRLSPEKIEELDECLQVVDFLNYEYEPTDLFVTDQPSCITTVVYEDDTVKTIDHYLGHELKEEMWVENDKMTLREFEDEIDRISGTEAYIGNRFL